MSGQIGLCGSLAGEREQGAHSTRVTVPSPLMSALLWRSKAWQGQPQANHERLQNPSRDADDGRAVHVQVKMVASTTPPPVTRACENIDPDPSGRL